MLETVKNLCALAGASGCEDEVRDYIAERVHPHADEIIIDAMGNLLVYKKGKKPAVKTVMLCAHMDEVGVIITGICDDGRLNFDFVGGVDRRVAIGKRVFLGKNKVLGVIAYGKLTANEKKTVPAVTDLRIDIGTENKEDAEKLVALGDTGVFDSETVEFGDGFLKAKAIDDRVGCAVMLKLIESELPIDCWFAFTVQEEVGTRGAFGAAFRITPDIALTIEGTTAADIPSVPQNKKVCAPGQGVVIPFMDRGSIANRDLYALITGLAEKNGIPWQTKQFVAGGTDAGAIQRTKAGVKTIGIAAAVRYIHSPACVARVKDFEDMLKLSYLFLEAVGNDDGLL